MTIYVAEWDGKKRLVRANNQAGVARHIIKSTVEIRVAGQEELAQCVSDGIKIEDSGVTLIDGIDPNAPIDAVVSVASQLGLPEDSDG
ncbi:MAG: hypothetical protein IPL86_15955 [Flavobacteriales bacterium]|nr:hypothetical protein [Flavobacteriales bacterium]